MKFLNQSKYKSGKETWKQYDLFALIISHIRLRVGGIISVVKIEIKFWREKCIEIHSKRAMIFSSFLITIDICM